MWKLQKRTVKRDFIVMRVNVTWKKNRPLSVLTGVRIRRVIFRENFVGTLEIVSYTRMSVPFIYI